MKNNISSQSPSIEFPELSPNGRDALNLVEFPLALLSDRKNNDSKTLVFNDRVWDKGQRQHVERRLTITASDRYGLPTALDDEVILGLLQLSQQHGFVDRRVPFTRYQLIQILNWRDEGKSYKRLETSLKRWLGVTLYYERAWWDPRNQTWADKHFHLLDNLLLYHRKAGHNATDAVSYFTWNQEVFDSFQSGSLKQVDMQLYRSLKLPTSKRLFRFLDKRFYFSSTLTFDLKTFAHEHVGMSRSYDYSQIKRRLTPAIEELAKAGFLASNHETMFQQVRRGEWSITLVRGKRKPMKVSIPANTQESALKERGVSAKMAKRLSREHPADYIDKKLAVFDQLHQSNDKRVSRNPSGYLVRSIIDDYDMPNLEKPKPPKIKPQKPRRVAVRKRTVENAEQKQVDEYLDKLSDKDRLILEETALSCASPLQLKGLHRAESDGSENRIAHYRHAIVQSHVRKQLKSLAEKKCD